MTKFTKHELENLKRIDLVQLAKERKIKNYSRMKKRQLVRALLKYQEKDLSLATTARQKSTRKDFNQKILQAELEKQEHHIKKYAETSRDDFKDAPESRYDLGKIKEYPTLKRYQELPDSYGENKLVLMVRDPYWVFAYWEMTPGYLNQFIQNHQLADVAKEYILRLYQIARDQGDSFEAGNVIDFPLHSMTRKYYMNVPTPGAAYIVDFGVRTDTGEFYTMLRSNKVSVPGDTMSNVVDEQWMTLADEESFRRLYQLSGGEIWKTLRGSEEFVTGRAPAPGISSGISSFGASEESIQQKKRSFRLKLDAELIVYGSTEPDAEVYIDGEKIELNPDGTFSIRLSFPNGTIRIPVEAHSADGKEIREIEPTFYRITRYAQHTKKEEAGE